MHLILPLQPGMKVKASRDCHSSGYNIMFTSLVEDALTVSFGSVRRSGTFLGSE